MIDLSTTVVATISEILPLRYELSIGDKVEFPCATYIESNNASIVDGNTIRYSNLVFTIKIYSYDKEELMTKALLVDDAMYSLGFRREYSNEMSINGQIIKVINYQQNFKELLSIGD